MQCSCHRICGYTIPPLKPHEMLLFMYHNKLRLDLINKQTSRLCLWVKNLATAHNIEREQLGNLHARMHEHPTPNSPCRYPCLTTPPNLPFLQSRSKPAVHVAKAQMMTRDIHTTTTCNSGRGPVVRVACVCCKRSIEHHNPRWAFCNSRAPTQHQRRLASCFWQSQDTNTTTATRHFLLAIPRRKHKKDNRKRPIQSGVALCFCPCFCNPILQHSQLIESCRPQIDGCMHWVVLNPLSLPRMSAPDSPCNVQPFLSCRAKAKLWTVACCYTTC